MSMQVGQIVKSTESSSITQFLKSGPSFNLKYIHDYSYDNADYNFYNTCFEGNFLEGVNYYFKVPILRKQASQEIIIEFYDGDSNTQRIKRVVIPAKEKDKIQDVVEFVATPVKTYHYLTFRIVRTSFDYTTQDLTEDMMQSVIGINNSLYLPPGRVVRFTSAKGIDSVDGNDYQSNVVINLFKDFNSYPKKVGIQGPSGTMMSINGEEIRIGYRGVYELLNGIIITSLGVIPKGNESIIIDYQIEG